MKTQYIDYYYRGEVERGTGNRRTPYRWHPGYSETSPEGRVQYPWMTATECRREADERGATARFHNNVLQGEL